ncbi:MAG: hypothetical protein FD189_2076 [Elusimicrobia bacterium]|nr:MAG: hypothetical protein FD154_1778 [Elusimicrobiota bacterium]KAF0154126.1 MAG: hypothetical protein FD189_2076 [Elusimicrobiota bacterium]
MSLELGSGWVLLLAAALLPAAALRLFRGRAMPPAAKYLRLASFLLLAAALADPVISRVERRPVPPRLAFLVDAGAAMAGPCSKGAAESRRDCAGAWARRAADALGEKASSSIFYFPGAGSPAQEEPPASFSRDRDLGAALAWLASAPGGPWDRVFVLTSGHDLRPPPVGAAPADVTLVSVGPPSEVRRLGAPRVAAPAFAYLHMPFRVFAESRLENSPPGASASLEILSADGKVVSSAAARTDGYGLFGATFTLRTDVLGMAAYRVRARASGLSVSSPFRVQAVREKLRVLHLSGPPSFDYAALRDHLKSDPGVDLVSFVILRNPEDAAGVAEKDLSLIPFPVHDLFLKDLRNFDVLILHAFDLRRFVLGAPYLQSVERFVAGGGGLLVIGGPQAFGSGGYAGLAPLASLLPAEVAEGPDYSGEAFTVEPARHPAAAAEAFGGRGAPPLGGLNLLGGPVGGGRLIYGYRAASGASGALAAERGHGKGRVVALASPRTWMLRSAGGGRYSAFWEKMLSFLDGTLGLERVALEADESYPPRLRLRVLGADYRPLARDAASINASVTGPGGRRPVEFYFRGAGVYEAEVPPPFGGRQTVSANVSVDGRAAGSPALSFSPEGPSAYSPPDLRALEEMARPRGWTLARMEDSGGAALERLLPPPSSTEIRTWSAAPGRSPWLLAAFLLLLGIELGVRRRAGRD